MNEDLNHFEAWVLSLDKYIDGHYFSKAKKAGFVTGAVAFIGCTYIVIKFDIFLDIYPKIAVGAFPTVYLYGAANYWLFIANREMGYRSKEGCYGNKDNLKSIGQRGWIKSRLLEHYLSTVDVFIYCFLLGWCATVIVAIIIKELLN